MVEMEKKKEMISSDPSMRVELIPDRKLVELRELIWGRKLVELRELIATRTAILAQNMMKEKWVIQKMNNQKEKKKNKKIIGLWKMIYNLLDYLQ